MAGKVLLIRNVQPEFYGGGETYQLKLASELKKNGFEPYIVTSSKKLLVRGEELGFKVMEAPYNKRQNWSGVRNLLFIHYCVWQKKLKKWYGEVFDVLGPEVINVQSRDDFIAATLAAKKRGIRVLWTDHMDFRSWVLTNVKVPYKNLIGKWILGCAKKVDKIIMISDHEKTFFDSVYKSQNVVVVKNGAIDEYDKYKNIVAKEKSFVYVGRVVSYKGIKELIEAFKKVREKYPSAILNIYGGGDIEKYHKMAGAGVKFYGVTDEPLEAISKDEIFVLPSYREGLSLSLLDAAMMKKKIIVSNVGGNPEVVEDGWSGMLVPPKNVEKLTEAMIWMLDNPKVADKMAKEARRNYEKKFNFEKIFAEKMLPLYNNKKEL